MYRGIVDNNDGLGFTAVDELLVIDDGVKMVELGRVIELIREACEFTDSVRL